MFNKKYFFMLLLFIVAIGAVTTVSAGEVNGTDVAALNDDAGATEEIAISNEDSEVPALADEVAVESNDDSDKLSAVKDEDKISDGESGARIIASSKTFNYGSAPKVSVKVVDGDDKEISGTIVKLVISGKEYSAKTGSNGVATFQLPKLAKGKYTAAFSLTGSLYYGITMVFYTVQAGAAKSVKLLPTKLTTTYASGKAFKVRAVDGSGNAVGGVKLKVVVYIGSKYQKAYITTNSKGYAALLPASKLSVGTHKVVVSSASSNYKASAKTSYIKINKIPLAVTAKSVKGKTFGAVHIKVANKATKKLVNGVKLLVSIYSGSSVKKYTLITGYDSKIYKSNGVAAIETNKFSIGSHKVVISVVNKYYRGSASATLNIPAAAKNAAKYTGVVSNGQAKKI